MASHGERKSTMMVTAGAAVFVLIVILSAVAAGAISDCNSVVSLISGCSNFVAYGVPEPTLGAPCCDGLTSLYNAADSTQNRRLICSCLMSLITSYAPNATTVARLPGLCGISLGFTIEPNTNCNSIP